MKRWQNIEDIDSNAWTARARAFHAVRVRDHIVPIGNCDFGVVPIEDIDLGGEG